MSQTVKCTWKPVFPHSATNCYQSQDHVYLEGSANNWVSRLYSQNSTKNNGKLTHFVNR